MFLTEHILLLIEDDDGEKTFTNLILLLKLGNGAKSNKLKLYIYLYCEPYKRRAMVLKYLL